MDILGVNGYRVDLKNHLFGVALAGKSLVNADEFKDGYVNLAPYSSVKFKIKTEKISKFSAGTYNLNAGAFMNIEVVGITSSLTRVDFHSDYEKPTRITFDRGYPSTRKEREQWEMQERKERSYFPDSPG